MDGAIDSLLDRHWMEHLDGCSPGLRILAATDRHGEVAIEVIGELPHLAFLEVIDPAM